MKGFSETTVFICAKWRSNNLPMLATAIEKTKKFIYLEDQYFINSSDMRIGKAISKLLARKVEEDEFKFLVVLTTNGGALRVNYTRFGKGVTIS